MYPHRIRLAGPWQCEPLTGANPAASTVTLPYRGSVEGRVRLRRRFGWVARVEAFERVWLQLGGVEGTADVWLNDQPLGRGDRSEGPLEFEVTPWLRPRNELLVEIESPTGGALHGEVALEVRCQAFLRGVEARTTVSQGRSGIEVTGEVVGTASRPLDLYLLHARRTVAQATVLPTPEGQPFRLTSEGMTEGPAAGAPVVPDIRVELVDGSTRWYIWEGKYP